MPRSTGAGSLSKCCQKRSQSTVFLQKWTFTLQPKPTVKSTWKRNTFTIWSKHACLTIRTHSRFQPENRVHKSRRRIIPENPTRPTYMQFATLALSAILCKKEKKSSSLAYTEPKNCAIRSRTFVWLLMQRQRAAVDETVRRKKIKYILMSKNYIVFQDKSSTVMQ